MSLKRVLWFIANATRYSAVREKKHGSWSQRQPTGIETLVLYVLSCPSVFPAAGFRTFVSDVPIYTCGSFHKAEVKDNKSATAAG